MTQVQVDYSWCVCPSESILYYKFQYCVGVNTSNYKHVHCIPFQGPDSLLDSLKSFK